MSQEKHEFEINTFEIFFSTDVRFVVSEVSRLKKQNAIIHISSYMHNTVLVQTLKKELSKVLPDIKVALLNHDDKTKTLLTMFHVDNIKDEIELSDAILNEVYLEYLNKDKSDEKARNQLFSRYFTDHLTNLPNVYQLRKDLQLHEHYGLVIVKIDNFITINNFYGFIIGDYIIEEISKYLKELLSKHKVYKLPGSEFAFTLSKNMNFHDLKEYLSEIYEEIKYYSVVYQQNKIFIDFTMASTSSFEHTNIFSKVSMALKYANEIGVAFWIYEERMNFESDYKMNFLLSEVVRDGVKNSRVVPYFQAIVDNKTSKITKYECLARLLDGDGNVLSPLLFIPVAKKIKAYNNVTKQMIDKSFKTFEDSELEFNINLSMEDIMSSEIFNFILDKLKNFKAASRVTFELLESEAIKDFTKVEHFINEVRRYGAKIAIDDFGSGYSNFSYLIKIKTNYIKIDGELIKNIDTDESSLIVVQTIVDFAKKLGIKTVAEYVHSSVIMDKVKELGIDYSQGFYIDEPSISKKSYSDL